MKLTKSNYIIVILAALLLSTLNPQLSAAPLGTAFTYHGYLTDGTNAVNGSYDLKFSLYDAVTNGSQTGVTLTNTAVAVSNGLFMTTLDFGADVFTGSARWLEIGVRTGTNNFTLLSPRQPVTPTPYALYSPSAGGMAASNLVGTIPDARIATNVARLDDGGRLPDTALSTNVALLNSSPVFSGAVTASAFSGNGSALTNLNAANLASGTIPDARLSGTFTGNGSGLTNLNAGSLASGVLLSARLAGTYSNVMTFNNRTNSFTGDGSGLTNLNAAALMSGLVPSGRLTGAYSATLYFNNPSNRYWGKFFGDGSMITNLYFTASGTNYVGSGYYLIGLNADNIGYGTIADEHLSNNIVRQGGDPNFHDVNAGGNVQANGNVQAIGNIVGADLVVNRLNVGQWHSLAGAWSSIAGGEQNTITNADFAFIGGGIVNSILDGNRSADGNCSVIAGGSENMVSSSNYCSTISGGSGNSIGEGNYCSTIGGGSGNSIQTNATGSTIGGGEVNSIQTNALCSTIGGGYLNTVNPNVFCATIPGGCQNEAGGSYSFAGGFHAHALHNNTFVWSDGNTNNFTSTDDKQFLIQAFHGVGINTNNPQAALHVVGTIKANAFVGDGSGITGITIDGSAMTASNANRLEGYHASAFALLQSSPTFTGTVTAAGFVGDGSRLTNITTGSLSVSNADRLDGYHATDFALLGSSPTFSGTVTASAFMGGGSGLTSLDANNLASGTVPDARLNPSPIFAGTVTASRLKIGFNHSLSGIRASITGGLANTNDASDAIVSGGITNNIDAGAYYSAIAGGRHNNILSNGVAAFVAGGWDNTANGWSSFAAGYHARALHWGTFVWADRSEEGNFNSTGSHQFLVRAAGGVGINTNSPQTALHVNGTTRTCALEITGGCDLAEPFPTSTGQIPKGAVVVIDEANPGHLKMSDLAYDTKVAGIVSGANDINPGISLSQHGLGESGQNVALSGRVYALADASKGPIQPGDLLTTSDTPGHAMKVTEQAKAQGAILGKAMTGLKEGRGMVLVLVTLQ